MFPWVGGLRGWGGLGHVLALANRRPRHSNCFPQLSGVRRVWRGSAQPYRSLRSFEARVAAWKTWPLHFVVCPSAVCAGDKSRQNGCWKESPAGAAPGPREGHMTRLAARAAGAGKEPGEGGAWRVTCLRYNGRGLVLWPGAIWSAFTPPTWKRSERRQKLRDVARRAVVSELKDLCSRRLASFVMFQVC